MTTSTAEPVPPQPTAADALLESVRRDCHAELCHCGWHVFHDSFESFMQSTALVEHLRTCKAKIRIDE